MSELEILSKLYLELAAVLPRSVRSCRETDPPRSWTEQEIREAWEEALKANDFDRPDWYQILEVLPARPASGPLFDERHFEAIRKAAGSLGWIMLADQLITALRAARENADG